MIHLNDQGQLHRTDGPAVDENGNQEWWVNGKRHREDGPAQILADGYTAYWLNDKQERADGPAIIEADGSEYWYRNGKLHREDGPAVVKRDGTGTQEWYQDGVHHREDGPAVIKDMNGQHSEEWYNHGVLDRSDGGPAVIEPDGTQYWFKAGQLHRVKAAAIERSNGTKEYFTSGQRDRKDGPAIQYADGSEEWYRKNKLDRKDGPAISYADGTQMWYRDGVLDRKDGPALINADGTEAYYVKGTLHRAKGPAVVHPDGTQEFYHNGELVKTVSPLDDQITKVTPLLPRTDAASKVEKVEGKKKAPKAPKKKAAEKPQGDQKQRRFGGRVKKTDISNSIRSLGIMLEVSRGEVGPISTLAQQYAGNQLGDAYARIAHRMVDESLTMLEAFELEPIFPPIVTEMILVGSKGGNTYLYLERAAEIIDEGDDLVKKIRSSMIQPGILLTLIVVFVFATVTFIMPNFTTIFDSLGKPLPTLTSLLINGSKIMSYVMMAAFAAGIGYVLWWFVKGKKSQKVRLWMDKKKFTIPVLGKVLQSQKVNRLFSIMASLFSVGIPESQAITIAAAASGNRYMEKHMLDHLRKMEDGEATFAEMADGKTIPLMAGFIIKNGQDSGQLESTLQHLAKVYRKEAQTRTDSLNEALEPLLNGAVSLIFSGITILIYLPVYEMFTALTEV